MRKRRMFTPDQFTVEVAICDSPTDKPYTDGRATWDGEVYFVLCVVTGPQMRQPWIWEGWVDAPLAVEAFSFVERDNKVHDLWSELAGAAIGSKAHLPS